MRNSFPSSGESFHNAAMGAVSWMRTGNIIVDMAIAMAVPVVFRWIFEGGGKQAMLNAWHYILSIMHRSSSRIECIRTISHNNSTRHGNMMEMRNELLQKALALYFTEVVKVSFKGRAQVALTALHDARFQYERPDKYNPLASYRLTWLAPEGEWVEMDREDGVEFRQFTHAKDSGDSDNNGNASKTKEVVYELRCTGNKKQASTKIDALIQRAVEWYKDELKRQQDDSRYFYSMSVVERFSIGSGDSKDADGPKYKRYKLSDHKQFDSLFFPEKDALLALLDDFEQKRGKYAVSGFPHKLGVMLHGPPGTGKTSLIKALAHATNRSIVSIPLGQIKTNQQLMDVMYDLKLSVAGCETPQLEFKDVIFVIEDVDAASKIVLRRDGKVGSSSNKSFGSAGAASDRDNEPEISPDGLRSLAMAAARAQSPDKSTGGAGAPDAEGPKAPRQGLEDMMEALVKPAPDALNLAGLLNVLDGVVDTPGRLLILTSNHPDKLDPALIRPGRVDRLIHLDYMKPSAAAAMISHYFGGEALSAYQRKRLDELLGGQVTPAVLEQLCARHATVDELLADLSAQACEHAATAPPLVVKEATAGTAGAAVDGDEIAVVAKPVPLTTAAGSVPPAFLKRQTSAGG